ncbi:hypothetical protein QNO07_23575 [Streptomyces sp. 549]|uniref:hypothetical protein n=1 Tax=Streptomyces sp. 549 TaxID=3049076 RepID=UPI0024C4284C|nr:hypothetical protein [Streptomyces sp. 549]MDK1476358.1 hypothetical protein [Streptomyces sp. 549]
MNRSRLAQLLTDGADATGRALAALRHGGEYVVWDGTSPSNSLAGIYERRHRHALRKGIETLGLERAVRLLELQGRQPARLGRIDSPDRAWSFMVFLTEDRRSLIACTALRRRMD